MKVTRRLALAPEALPLETSDEEDALVCRSRQGDIDSFARLYARYRDEVYVTCLRRLRDAALAEDVVQDTFIRAYQCLNLFDEQRRLLPWLITIAKRRCIDIQRSDRRAQSTSNIETTVRLDDQGDATLDAVLAGEERQRLELALRRLNPRQRRAILLHAVEGWSQADIANAEGISVPATKSLLFHARENLRRACRRGALGSFAFPFIVFKRRARALHDRLVARIAGTEPIFSSASASVAQGLTVLVVAMATLATSGSAAAVVAARGVEAAPRVRSSAASTHGVALAKPPATQSHSDLARAILNPTAAATPDNSHMTSIVASPNYANDHTLFGVGSMGCAQGTCSVLFISRDGGATWVRQPTLGFDATQIILPPSYPADPRIFAMGKSGLSVSGDQGRTFEPIVPLTGQIAISPLFDRADHSDARLLIGASTVTEYWPDTNLVQFKPATLVGPSGTWLTLAFSPAYAQDKTIFVGGIRPDTSGVMRPAINRCASSVCDGTVFTDGFDAPSIRPSPNFARDDTVYGFTTHVLFRSIDGGKSFLTLMPSFAGSIRDLLVSRVGTLFAAVQGGAQGNDVYVSSNGGSTWIGRSINLRGFGGGTTFLTQTPDGRLIAIGTQFGLACSMDSGRTWAARCKRA